MIGHRDLVLVKIRSHSAFLDYVAPIAFGIADDRPFDIFGLLKFVHNYRRIFCTPFLQQFFDVKELSLRYFPFKHTLR